MQILNSIRKIANIALQRINQDAERAEKLAVIFGIFGVVTYAFYYIIWVVLNPQGYENSGMRSVIIVLCALLILKPYWPKKCLKFFPLFWYLTILYSLPFFVTFFLLKHGFSNLWILNAMTMLVLMVLLLDIVPMLIILVVGVTLACLSFYVLDGALPQPKNYYLVAFSYISIVFFSVLFVRNREITQKEKQLEAMALVSASMAHEIRTPLATINTVALNLKKYYPILFDAYREAKQAGLPVGDIRQNVFAKLEQQPALIEVETNAASNVIDMLLMSINPALGNEGEIFSMAECVDEALARYPFRAEQREMIRWNNTENNDFLVAGKKILLIYVLFNLIRNALYYVEKAGKGSIYIWIEKSSPYNLLYFKDTGMGIAQQDLPHIFERFFTRTRHGAGVGLSFSKLVMKSLKGDISCKSRVNDYTLFKLCFPKKNKTKES